MHYDVDDYLSVHRVRRTAVPFESLQQLDDALALLSKRLEALPPRRALLVDLRVVAPRNDVAFEQRVGIQFPRLVGRYARTAYLVKTAAGVLQLKRLSTAEPGSSVFHNDEKSAISYLIGR